MYRGLAILSASIVFASTILHAQTATQVIETKSQVNETIKMPSTKTPSDEDWTTIYLAKSNLPLDAIGGVPLSKVDEQGCTRELLRMKWRPNDPIDLYVIRPNGAAKLPVVLFLYHYTYDTDIFREDRWCERARQNGFAVAGFTSALSPQRIHMPRPLKEWFVSEMQEALATSTHDVQMVLNYLETRGDLDMKHVGMFGQGSGGAIVILAAAADPRISVLDLMDPWGDWPDWIKDSKQIPETERDAYLKPEFLQKVSNLDPVDYLPQLKGRAVRIQQVISDPITPPSARDKIAHAAQEVEVNEVTRYPDVAAEAKALGANGIMGWLGEQLNPQESRNGVHAELQRKDKSTFPKQIPELPR